MDKPIWVWKLGGSLLDLADFPRRLETALDLYPHRPLLIIGGGGLADEVRRWDQRFEIGEAKSHDLALHAMALNEQLISVVWPRSTLVADRTLAQEAWRIGRVPVLQTSVFLKAEESRHQTESSSIAALPHTWDATSDTIAAWITLRWPAEGLLLLKSIDRPTGELGDAVDPMFSRFSEQIDAFEWLNLRTVEPSPRRL